MAAGAVFRYFQEVYSQPSFYNLWSSGKWLNSSELGNSSLDYSNNTELISFQEEAFPLPLSAAHFGLATGLLAILLNSNLLSTKFLKCEVRASEIQQWAEALLLRVFFATACLLLAATVAPIVAVTLFLLAFYRQFVNHVLSLTNSSFASLLEGTDAVWALEDDASKSIINVLAIFEVEIIDNVFKPQLLGMLRKLMRERVLTSPEACPKFWQYRRRSKLGYFYWENQKEVRIEDHIQYMTQEDDIVNLEAPDLSEDSFRQEYYGMSESVLKGLVSELANSPLPYDNAASWEILIGRDPILEDLPEVDPFEAMEEGKPEASGRFRRYPVLFRVHHSMGDGVALIRLLLDALADKKGDSETPSGIITTKIVNFDNEGMNLINRKKTLEMKRLDKIDLIACSTGSFDDLSRPFKAKRPNFIDLSPTINENLEKKVKPNVLETESDDSEESVQISVRQSDNIIFRRSSKSFDSIPSQSSESWGSDIGILNEEVFVPVTLQETAESTYLAMPVRGKFDEAYDIDVNQKELFWFTEKESIEMLEDNKNSVNKITLDHNEKKIYFDNKNDVERLDDMYEKVVEYSSPLPSDQEFFKDLSPPTRCKSPLPPFRRDVSRIARVLDEIPKAKTTPFLQDNQAPPRKSSPNPRMVSETIRSDSPFLMDNSPPRMSSPVSKIVSGIIRNDSPLLINKSPARKSSTISKMVGETIRSDSPFLMDNSPPRKSSPVPRIIGEIIRSDSPFLIDNSLPCTNSPNLRDDIIIRNESPVPKIHRKKYPALWNDMDTELSPPTTRKNAVFSRSSSPFMNDFIDPNHGNQIPKFDSQFQKSGALKLQNDSFCSRSYSPLPKYNSSIMNDNSISRCDTPFERNSSPLPQNDRTTTRCDSPFQRNNTPIPRNDHPIPRCNSPFQRSNSPLPSIDKSIRCISPFSRNSSPLASHDNVQPNSSLKKSSPTKTQLNSRNIDLENSKKLNGESSMGKKLSTYIPQLSRANGSCVKSIHDIRKKPTAHYKNSEEKNVSAIQDIPLAPVNFNTSSMYTEHFIKGYFFSPDGEVINKCSTTPNCFIKLLDSINHRPSKFKNICSYVRNVSALVFTPASLVHQTMVKAADVNPLHGPVLSGQKVVSWYFDSMEDKSDNLLSTIKRIKSRMSDARFTDVFLSALSSSLESYFLQGGCESKFIPDTISVVIPVRMTTPEEIAEGMAMSDKKTGKTIGPDNSKLSEYGIEETKRFPAMENKFSVGLLSLPITSISTDTKIEKSLSPIGRLRNVCKHTDLLRQSPDYHVNYWLMRVVSTFLPLPLLAPVLNSTQSTMVVSNLLGPPTQIELGGYKLKDIVFWVPNRGSTGVGVSVLSYAGRLQIGIVADRALISCQQDANIILEGVISELQRLDDLTAPITNHPLKV